MFCMLRDRVEFPQVAVSLLLIHKQNGKLNPP